MTSGGPERLLATVLVLVGGAAVVLACSSSRSAQERVRAGEFQRTVLGLGGGTATSMVPCAAAYDRTAGVCDFLVDPIPAGGAFCPHHAGPSLSR